MGRPAVPVMIACRDCGTLVERWPNSRFLCSPCAKERIRKRGNQWQRNWYAKNRDEYLPKQREWYAKNAERCRESQRRWREKSRDHYLAVRRRKHAENPAPYRERVKKWRLANRDVVAAIHRRYRARKKRAPGAHTAEQFINLCDAHRWLCHYCGASLSRDTVTADHKTPLMRGGSDDIENIVPSCRECNSSKHTLTYEEFMATRWRERCKQAA